MRILTIDVGTGTQDVLLFDSDREIENCFKLVLPSPTANIGQQIRAATADQRPLLLTGATMGGGPCHWAAMDHLRAGLPVMATLEAAQSFDDDAEAVQQMGITLVADGEARRLIETGRPSVVRFGDLWLEEILATFERFGVPIRFDALAIAAFDHGAAPPGTSDRVFRFNYLRERLAAGSGLVGFAFLGGSVPASLTRLRAIERTAPSDVPLLLMDTAPAAVLGALDDQRVRTESNAVLANVGNFHSLAFHFVDGAVAALFEHHSGELTADELATYVRQLGEGTISNEAVLADMGHGALVLNPNAPPPTFVSVTGPRRALLLSSGIGIAPHQAVPHGDMMLAGNFGLLRAFATQSGELAEHIEWRLGPPANLLR